MIFTPMKMFLDCSLACPCSHATWFDPQPLRVQALTSCAYSAGVWSFCNKTSLQLSVSKVWNIYLCSNATMMCKVDILYLYELLYLLKMLKCTKCNDMVLKLMWYWKIGKSYRYSFEHHDRLMPMHTLWNRVLLQWNITTKNASSLEIIHFPLLSSQPTKKADPVQIKHHAGVWDADFWAASSTVLKLSLCVLFFPTQAPKQIKIWFFSTAGLIEALLLQTY